MGYLSEYIKASGEPLTKGSITSLISAAGRLFEYLKEKGLVVSNPFKSLPVIRNDLRLPNRPLKENDMGKLLSSLARFDENSDFLSMQRNYLVHVAAELMYSTGMRVGEAAGLLIDDVNIDKGEVLVREGKGGEMRICFLNSYACEVLRLYIEKGRKFSLRGKSKEGWLLFGVTAGRLAEKIGIRLRETCKKKGFIKQTSHSFRHAFGAHFLRSGCDIREIMGFLGHKKLRTTQIYTKLEKEDLRNVLDTYHPRSFRRALE